MTSHSQKEDMQFLFDYLDKEITFQAAISTVTGAAAVWIVKEVLFSAPAHNRVLVKLGVLALFSASALFLFERGQLSRKLGTFASKVVFDEPITRDEIHLVIRRASSWRVLRNWWEYYLARFCVLAAGIVFGWLLLNA